MANLNTADVKVFPSTRRVATQVDARLMTEASMVGIINQLINKDGFVITETFNESNPFEFNIYGYYFIVNQGSSITTLVSSGTEIIASIKIDTTNGYYELVGQDNNNAYEGLNIGTSAVTPGSNQIVKSLKILEKVNGVWQIPEASKVMFSQDNIDIIDIDGGEITA